MGKNPQDIKETEPTAKTVDNSPVIENQKVQVEVPVGPKLKPNQSYTLSGCVRTDN